MREGQATISAWALETFGLPSSPQRVATRANEEMAEILRVVTSFDLDAGTARDRALARDRIVEECADVVIVLYRLADILGRDLHWTIDAKMVINRKRVWKVDKDGTGQHARDKSDG